MYINELYQLQQLFHNQLETPTNMNFSIHRSPFNPILSQDNNLGNQQLIEMQAKRVLNANQTVQVSDLEQQLINFPYLLRLILSLYYSLSKKCEALSAEGQEVPFLPNRLTAHVKYSLLKLLTTIIQKKLFVSLQSQRYYDEISYSLLFKQCLFSLFISILSENTNFVIVERIVNFYRTLVSQQYTLYLPIQIYYLYGGGVFTIDVRVFKEKLINLIEGLGKTLSSSQTVISRNIQFFKITKQRQVLLDQSIKMVILSKNKEGLTEIVNHLANSIFTGRDYLKKQQFLLQLQSKPLQPLLTITLQLVRAQFVLLEQNSFLSHLLIRSETSKTNFYTHEISKLFNKCPFNGDERCDCKKCQCVRRNRQSAKISQQKKRNAVEQVEQFRRRIAELQESNRLKDKKVMQLQEQNMMLKSLMKEMKQNPNMKSLMMQTIEPVSKILNNEL